MSRLQTSFILGFHGCDRAVGENAVAGRLSLLQSKTTFDWLGAGIYFWEGDLQRAFEWAEAKAAKTAGFEPFVIGAVIDLGNCLDLTMRKNIELLKETHDALTDALREQGIVLPRNRDAKGDANNDLLLRERDCAVISYLHDSLQEAGREPFDTVRGMFQEGKSIYETSGFRERTHTQIAVRTASCIKGIFIPMP